MGFDDELNPACFEGFIYALDVVHLVVNDRGRMIQIRPVRNAQHQTDAITVEEGHAGRRLKQKCHAEYLAIESDRAVEILYVDEDLTDARQTRANWDWVSHDFAPSGRVID